LCSRLEGMRRRSFLILPLTAAAAPPATDFVIAVEESPGFAPIAASLTVPDLPQGCRVAVLGFNAKTRLLGKFSADAKEAGKAVRRASPRFQLGGGRGVQTKEIRVFGAIAAAAKLLEAEPPKKRAIVVVFGTDDCCSPPASLPEGIRVVALATQPYIIDNWA